MEASNIFSKIRKENGLSQDEMASKLFVTRQAVSRWENGETSPNIETMKAISKEFNVSINSLLNLPEEPVCQSCGMDLKTLDDFGKNADDSIKGDYCKYCFQEGSFTHNRTIDEMVEFNLKFLDEYNKEKGLNFTPDEARVELKAFLKTLKRWN